MLTKQKVFDKVWQTFVVDKTPPSKQNSCFYGTKINGVGCAIGCCLPDGVGDKWDRQNFSFLNDVDTGEYVKYFHIDDLNCLSDIQLWHDFYLDIGVPIRPYVIGKLEEIAEKHSLNYPKE